MFTTEKNKPGRHVFMSRKRVTPSPPLGLLALRRRHTDDDTQTPPPSPPAHLARGGGSGGALAGCEWVSKHDDEFQICSEAATMDPNHVVLIKDEDSDDELLCAPTVLPHLSHLQLDAMAMRWRRDGDAMAT